jgi:hypothetical protein
VACYNDAVTDKRKKLDRRWGWPVIAFGIGGLAFGVSSVIACRILEIDVASLRYFGAMTLIVYAPALAILGIDALREQQHNSRAKLKQSLFNAYYHRRRRGGW